MKKTTRLSQLILALFSVIVLAACGMVPEDIEEEISQYTDPDKAKCNSNSDNDDECENDPDDDYYSGDCYSLEEMIQVAIYAWDPLDEQPSSPAVITRTGSAGQSILEIRWPCLTSGPYLDMYEDTWTFSTYDEDCWKYESGQFEDKWNQVCSCIINLVPEEHCSGCESDDVTCYTEYDFPTDPDDIYWWK